MHELLMVFNRYGSRPAVVAKVRSRKKKGIKEAFQRACKKASQEGYSGMNYAVPAKYLSEEGLSLEIQPVTEMWMENIEDETAPVRICRCEECMSYDEGVCFRYGGSVDGLKDSADCDRFHGSGKILRFDGELAVPFAFETKLSPEGTAEYLRCTELPALTPLKEALLDYARENDWNTDNPLPIPFGDEAIGWELEDVL